MVRRIVCLCTLLSALIPFVALAAGPAASDTGTIAGTVQTTTGAPIAGALVVVTGAVSAQQFSGPDGGFHFSLPPAEYTVTVSRGGFVPQQQSGLDVFIGETLKVPVTLTLADLSSLRSIGTTSVSAGQASVNGGAAAVEYLPRSAFTNYASPQINDVLQQLPDVTIERMGTQLDTSIVLGGVQPYETTVLIDGHPFSNGQFGVWLSEYFPSFLLDGAEIARGPGSMTPLANTAVGGTLNLVTPGFTDKTQASFFTGLDSFDTQYAGALASGSISKLRYVFDVGYGAENGPLYGKNLCSVLTNNSAQDNHAGSTGIIQFCSPGDASLFSKGEMVKLQYSFSQRTSFEIGAIGIAAGLSPQGTGYGQDLGPTTIVDCVPSPSSYTGTPTKSCTNPNFHQYVGQTINGYYWYPGSDVYSNQPIFTGQFRTSFGNDTLLVRPYAGNLTHYTDGSGENAFPWFFGPPGKAFTNYCNDGTSGSGYTKTAPPTVVGGLQECYQATFSELEHDKLSGATFLYLHPFGESNLTFSYDFHSDNTFAYFNNTSQIATPNTTERFGTLSLVGDLHLIRNLGLDVGLYDTTWRLTGSQPAPGATPNPTTFALPLVGLTRSVSRLDPRAGLVYRPTDRFSVRAAYGTSETYPFAGQVSGEPAVQLPSGAGAGTITQKNGLLNPETATQLSAGADLRMPHGGVLSLDLESTTMHNVFETLQSGTVTLPGLGSFLLIQPINAATLNAKLATLRYVVAPRVGLGYNLSVGFDSSQFSGIPLQYYASGPALPANGQQVCGSDGGFNPGVTTCIPYFKMYGQVTYTMQDGTFGGLGMDLEGKNNSYYQPPFAMWNLTLLRPVARTASVQISVQNLFNTNTFNNLPMPNAGVSVVAANKNGSLTNIPSILIPSSPRTLRFQLNLHAPGGSNAGP